MRTPTKTHATHLGISKKKHATHLKISARLTAVALTELGDLSTVVKRLSKPLRNMPDLDCIPPHQHDQAWALWLGMIIAMIAEVKNLDASTDVNDSIIEGVNDFFVTASANAAVNSLDLSSAEIADREIKICIGPVCLRIVRRQSVSVSLL